MRLGLALAVVWALPAGAQQAQVQGFTCAAGTRPTCLAAEEKVCPSAGRCVSAEATCFDAGTCEGDQKAFVCKTDLTTCAAAHDDVVVRYNKLVDDSKKLVAALEAEQARTKRWIACLNSVADLEAARDCLN